MDHGPVQKYVKRKYDYFTPSEKFSRYERMHLVTWDFVILFRI